MSGSGLPPGPYSPKYSADAPQTRTCNPIRILEQDGCSRHSYVIIYHCALQSFGSGPGGCGVLKHLVTDAVRADMYELASWHMNNIHAKHQFPQNPTHSLLASTSQAWIPIPYRLSPDYHQQHMFLISQTRLYLPRKRHFQIDSLNLINTILTSRTI
jgi:hypothetical protein